MNRTSTARTRFVTCSLCGVLDILGVFGAGMDEAPPLGVVVARGLGVTIPRRASKSAHPRSFVPSPTRTSTAPLRPAKLRDFRATNRMHRSVLSSAGLYWHPQRRPGARRGGRQT
jgi:hypothetical protein